MEAKYCGKCKLTKPTSAFSIRRKKGVVSLQCWCKACNAQSCRDLYHNGDRKRQIRERDKRQRKVLTSYCAEYKLKRGCQNCGYIKCSAALDFHHIKDKDYNIHYLSQRGVSIKKLQNEIDKCVVLCANCHREHHFLERQSKTPSSIG